MSAAAIIFLIFITSLLFAGLFMFALDFIQDRAEARRDEAIRKAHMARQESLNY